jgi:predicted RNase H-like HicB family nuclease
MFKYSIDMAWSEADACYVATIKEFPGLSAFGDTPEEAAKEAQKAARGFIKVLEEDGEKVPQPELLTTYSGQTRIRLPKSLHAALSQEAKTQGVSLNTYLIALLSERHGISQMKAEIETIKNILVQVAIAPITDTKTGTNTNIINNLFSELQENQTAQ